MLESILITVRTYYFLDIHLAILAYHYNKHSVGRDDVVAGKKVGAMNYGDRSIETFLFLI